MCPLAMSDHLHQFGYIVGISKSHRVWLVMIWCACIWIIWKDKQHNFLRQIGLYSSAYG